jgi:flagellar hook-length control protein FliK
VEQTLKQIDTMRLQSGRGEMTFHLRPDHLGALQIHLASTSEGVTARILAETHPVQQALEAERERLRQSLEDRGMNLVRMDVGLTSGGFSDRQNASPDPNALPQPRAKTAGAIRTGRIERAETVSAPETRSARFVRTDSRLDYSA